MNTNEWILVIYLGVSFLFMARFVYVGAWHEGKQESLKGFEWASLLRAFFWPLLLVFGVFVIIASKSIPQIKEKLEEIKAREGKD